MRKVKFVFALSCLFVAAMAFFASCNAADPEKPKPAQLIENEAQRKIKEKDAQIQRQDEQIVQLKRSNILLIFLVLVAFLAAAVAYFLYILEQKGRIALSKNLNIPYSPEPHSPPIPSKPISGLVDKIVSTFHPPQIKNTWLVTGASVIGKAHIQHNLPCQDKHLIADLGSGWGIAITCDGAGSAKRSDLGAAFVAKNACSVFKYLIKKHHWIQQRALPEAKEWNTLSIEAFQVVRAQLEEYAKGEELVVNDLACTIIVVIYAPIGLLVAHIGDGRAGYCNQSGEWLPLLMPWKGDEANQTVFLTSAIWTNPEKFIESRVISEMPSAFTLMSDGCEAHCFELGYFDQKQQKYVEKNSPYPKFFDPVVEQIKQMSNNKMSAQDIQRKWEQHLTNGSKGLANEPDDKTMILGILLH